MLKLDAIDHHILKELQRDGRIKNTDLADRIDLSASACFERVRRLETAGVILAYRAVLDVTLLGKRFDAWVELTLPDAARGNIEAFVEHVTDTPEVVSAHQLGGPEEFLLHIQGQSGAEWRTFLARLERSGLELSVSRTAIITECIKPPGGWRSATRRSRVF